MVTSTSPYHRDVSPVPANTSTYALTVWTRPGSDPLIEALQVVAFRNQDFDFIHNRRCRIERFTDLKHEMQRRQHRRLDRIQLVYGERALERARSMVYADLRNEARTVARQSPPNMTPSRLTSSTSNRKGI